jgi:beta-glucosidase
MLISGAQPALATLRHPIPHVMNEDEAAQTDAWFARHRLFVERARRGNIPLLFLGDSLTYAWQLDGRESWEKTFAKRGAVAFGIGGDRTEDLLWRIAHGELDGIAPKTVVLAIGTNDLGSGFGVDQSARGIEAVVAAARAKLPHTTILLLGVLPRGVGGPDVPMRRRIAAVNARLAKLDDGRHLHFSDCKDVFLDARGEVRPELFLPDLLHLSSAGYRAWAVSLDKRLAALSATLSS